MKDRELEQIEQWVKESGFKPQRHLYDPSSTKLGVFLQETRKGLSQIVSSHHTSVSKGTNFMTQADSERYKILQIQKRIPDKKHATLASSSSSWIPVLKNDGSVGVIHESSAVDLESIGDSLKLVLTKY
jgi:hypothetical protein